MPSKDVPDIGFFPDFDKFVHVCLYLGFAWLLCWSLKTENRPFFYFLILLFAFGWGSFMEVSQFLMHEGRNFEFFDIISNTTGASIGIIIYHFMAIWIKKQSDLNKK
jgi:VanZ family protein